MPTDKSDLIKSSLTIFLPLITVIVTANYQYVNTRAEISDQDYRTIVTQLTSKDEDVRHAAAANIGTYLKKDDRHYHLTIDILTSKLSTESNYNVRNSIISSLKKIKNEPEYRPMIDRLLTIDRGFFIQKYPMEQSLKNARNSYEKLLTEFKNFDIDYENNNLRSVQFDLNMRQLEVNTKFGRLQELQSEYDELLFNQPMVANMISIFLSEKKGVEINGLEFFRSTMNNVVLTDLILKNTVMKWAAFSSSVFTDSLLENSTIERTDFYNSEFENVSLKGSQISGTLFTRANLINTDFSESTLTDVYFAGANMKGTVFTNVINLKPEYFFLAENIDQVQFDNADFVKQIESIDAENYDRFIANSSLSNSKRKNLRIDVKSLLGL